MNTKEGGVFARSAKGFMGKEWDGVDENGIGIAQDPEMWRLLYNLLKPGAHLLAFSGSRTYHRMAVAIEDAGFEIRDMIEWVYGSGFPKSLNIGKEVDKIQGNEREASSSTTDCNYFPEPCKGHGDNNGRYGETIHAQATKGTSEWEGYGTALKPAHEPCVLARKPIDGTVANNVLKHGTGGLNIDGTRIKTSDSLDGGGTIDKSNYETVTLPSVPVRGVTGNDTGGRFPANLIHDGSDEVEAVFPQTGKSSGGRIGNKGSMINTMGNAFEKGDPGFGDSGSASRYFYCAKASKSERNAGLEGFELKEPPASARSKPAEGRQNALGEPRQNHHPTVKPLSLTKYLATLIKPPTGGRLLVPFSGSGSEMIGALQAGWEYVEGVELTEEYIPIAEARIKYWASKVEEESKQLELIDAKA